MNRILNRSENWVELLAPAKINLFLGITGLREDHFHQLSTIIAKVSIGDTLEIRKTEKEDELIFRCPGFSSLENPENLVCQAVRKWRERTGDSWGVNICLKKNIPAMSGLGGGSSDAVSALLGMHELSGSSHTIGSIMKIAQEIGSDCPAFLLDGLCLAEGRGEIVSKLFEEDKNPYLGQKVMLFRPHIGISTPEAYKLLASSQNYSEEEWVTEQVAAWKNEPEQVNELLHNDLENPVFRKYRFFTPLFQRLKHRFGIAPKMTGSGSCCFAFLPDDFDQEEQINEEISAAWGEGIWLQIVKIID